MPALAIVGPGRVGWALHDAVSTLDDWSVEEPLGRGDDRGPLARADLVMLAVPDRLIAAVARGVPVGPVVAHLSGATGFAELEPHEHRGSAHPLMTVPDRRTGAERLLDRCPFAVAGHPLVGRLVVDLGGQPFSVAESDRPLYHATAVIAANHVVAILAQAERIAGLLGLDPRLFNRLTTAAVADADRLGARAALTGPAVRGDWPTIEGHLTALPPDEHDLYLAVARAAADLGDHPLPSDLRPR